MLCHDFYQKRFRYFAKTHETAKKKIIFFVYKASFEFSEQKRILCFHYKALYDICCLTSK